MPTPKKKQAAEGEEGDAEREFRPVADAVLRECLVNLARVKDAITQALNHGEYQPMDQVPELMRGVVCGLLMLEKSRAVKQTEKISALIQQHVRPGPGAIGVRGLDRLADAGVSSQYYL